MEQLNETQRYFIDEHIDDHREGLISRRELFRRVTLIAGSSIAAQADIFVGLALSAAETAVLCPLTPGDQALRFRGPGGTSADECRSNLTRPGNRALPTPASEEEVRRLAAGYPSARADTIVAKWRKWRDLRIFDAQDAVYFLFFDDGGALQDYELAGK